MTQWVGFLPIFYSNPLVSVSDAYRPFAAIIEARAQAVREDWVKVYEARIIRDVLARCYKTEGVNHFQHCRHLAEAYLERLQTHRVGGLRRGPSEHVSIPSFYIDRFLTYV